MASKSGRGIPSKMPEGKVSVVWVKKANMWCKTWFEGGKQMQEWSTDRPEATHEP